MAILPPKVLLVSSILTLFTVGAMSGGLDYNVNLNSQSADDQTNENFATYSAWGPDGSYSEVPPSLDETQVIAIVLSSSQVQAWLENVISYDIFASYDGSGFWYVNILDNQNTIVETNPVSTEPVNTEPVNTELGEPSSYAPDNYIFATVEDATGKILELLIPKPATLTESEVVAIISSNSDVQTWFDSVSEFDSFVDYDGFGFWYISYFDTVNFNNFFFASVNDQTGQIVDLEILLSPPATSSEETILAIAMGAGLSDFLALYDDAVTSIHYGFGIWDVSAYSPTIIEASFWIEIDDSNGDIIFVETTNPVLLPAMNAMDVMAIVSATGNYTSFYVSNTDIWEEVFFYDGLWYVIIGAVAANGEYSELQFVVNDSTGEIVDLFSFDMGQINEDPVTTSVEPTQP